MRRSKKPFDPALVGELRQRFGEAKEFGELWDWYLTNFAENAEFMTLGHQSKGSAVERLLPSLLQRYATGPMLILQTVLTELPEHRLIHGTTRFKGHVAGLFFFPDLEAGMLCVSRLDGSNLTHYFRFGVTQERESARPN